MEIEYVIDTMRQGQNDSDDWLDDVCLIESRIFEGGKQDGYKYSYNGNNDNTDEDDVDSVIDIQKDYNNTHNFGFNQGYTFGLEIGFMIMVLSACLETDNSSPSSSSSSSSSSSRLVKRRAALLERLQAIPTENDDKFDFKHELDTCRALYKQCGSYTSRTSLGNFIPDAVMVKLTENRNNNNNYYNNNNNSNNNNGNNNNSSSSSSSNGTVDVNYRSYNQNDYDHEHQQHNNKLGDNSYEW